MMNVQPADAGTSALDGASDTGSWYQLSHNLTTEDVSSLTDQLFRRDPWAAAVGQTRANTAIRSRPASASRTAPAGPPAQQAGEDRFSPLATPFATPPSQGSENELWNRLQGIRRNPDLANALRATQAFDSPRGEMQGHLHSAPNGPQNEFMQQQMRDAAQ